MKLKNITTAAIIAAILLVSIIGFSLVKAFHKRQQEARSGRRGNAITVQTEKVGRHNLNEILTFNGDFQAIQSVALMPKISGRLLKLEIDGKPIEEGSFVKRGQLIGKIDDRDLKAQASNARAAKASAEAAQMVANANVDSAKAGIIFAQASLTQKKATYQSMLAAVESALAAQADKSREMERQAKLYSQKATTQQSYDQAVTAFDQAKAALRQAQASADAAKAQITSAEAELRQAEANMSKYKANVEEAKAAIMQADASLEQTLVNLSETELRAPMDGVVSKKNIDPGSMVSPTTTVVEIVDIEQIKVVISVPMTHLARLRPNQTKATLRTASLPGKVFDCVIYKIYPAVETVTRTAQVEIRVKNILDPVTGYHFRPGMYATVNVLIENRENVLAIDAALPIRNLEKNIVYRVKRGNGKDVPDTVEAVDVKMGVRFKSKVEILGGLKEGDEIVNVGQHRLTGGAPIRVLPGNNLKL